MKVGKVIFDLDLMYPSNKELLSSKKDNGNNNQKKSKNKVPSSLNLEMISFLNKKIRPPNKINPANDISAPIMRSPLSFVLPFIRKKG